MALRLLTLLIVLASPVMASAHGIDFECKLQGDVVRVEAFYDDGTPARNAKVTVFDADERRVANGKTDGDGRWTFPRPDAGKYRVDLNAGAGHFARRTIDVPPRDASTSATEQPISEGSSRAASCGFPWGRVAIGLGVIALFALLARVAARHRRAGRAER